MEEKWLGNIASALEGIIAYETWHDVTWLCQEDQETRLGYMMDRVASVKGKQEAWGNVPSRWWISWVESLSLMDQGNGEEQAKLQLMNQ
jgi:hypothetical protein